LAKPWLIPGLVSSLFLWAAFFPLSWGALAWVALVPLLTLARLPVSRSRVFFGAWWAGCVFFLCVLQWMRVAHEMMYYTWMLLSIYCALYFPIGILLIRFLDRRTPLALALSVPLVWTGLEFIRSFLFTGFAWYFLGYSQHANLPLIQIADLAGVYGVSFFVAAVNGWLLECVWLFVPLRRFLGATDLSVRTGKLTLACQGAGLALLLTGTLIYGYGQLAHADFEMGPKVALLQGNVDQRIRIQADTGEDAAAKVMHTYKHLSDRAYWQAANSPDLIIWPETAYPYDWLVLPDNVSQRSTDEIRYWLWFDEMLKRLPPVADRHGQPFSPEQIKERKASHLLGLSTLVKIAEGKYNKYNSALLYPFASDVKQDRYDKIHRVPFGEYVPLRDWLPFMNRLAPYDHDYSIHIGEKLTRFVLGKYRFGVLICNEDADPVLGRAYGDAGADGPAVDFLVNISNDGWFTDTSEHEQHLAICRFRAIECRRAVARAVNMGISAIIDSNGRVQKPEQLPVFRHENCEFWQVEAKDGVVPELPVSEWAEYKNVEGVLRGTMPIDHRTSLYARFGDWLPWGCCGVVVLGLIGSRWRGGKKQATIS
jgi:apolipoprotein N-acyltransferase